MPNFEKLSTGHHDWGQVGGYYDGDGCVIVRVRQFVVIFCLQWTDCSREQLDQVDRLLHSLGGISTKIYHDAQRAAYHLMVTKQDSVLRLAQMILPFTFKKRVELRVVVDYYRDRISGNEAIALMNEQIEKGIRSANLLSVSLPLTHTKAVKRARRRFNLTDAQVDEIQEKGRTGHSVSDLALIYGKSPLTIRKILAAPTPNQLHLI